MFPVVYTQKHEMWHESQEHVREVAGMELEERASFSGCGCCRIRREHKIVKVAIDFAASNMIE